VLVLSGQQPDSRLRTIARTRGLVIADEARGQAVRVHNLAELRGALIARVPMILLSPIYPTPSHPDWPPIPRMRAAATARLAHRSLFALGGMNDRRFARIRRLGFQGWAGVSAFRT
jgi:thiamine-phosphate pyrophosphorylase